MKIDVEIAEAQRNQFAYSIVRIGVAMGIVDGKQAYTGSQVAYPATKVEEKVLAGNLRWNKGYAAERQALLDALPELRLL